MVDYLVDFLVDGPLMKNVIKPLAKSVFIPLGLTSAASAADAGIQKKILESGYNNNTILIISNDEMKKIIKIVTSLDNSSLLPEDFSKTIQYEAEEQRGWFLSNLLGPLGASLQGNILTGKGVNRAGEGVIRAGYGDQKDQKATTTASTKKIVKTKWIFNAASSFD